MIELSGCALPVIDDPAAVEQALRSAAAAGGLEVLRVVMHRFEPQGVTGVVLLSESHLAIHTWPELGCVAADLFTCGDPGAIPAVVEVLRSAFSAAEAKHQVIDRVARALPVQ